jgi:hypothetical protein
MRIHTSGRIRVAVNRYGAIGKCIGDAERLQRDMELIGVSGVVSDYQIESSVALGLPLRGWTLPAAAWVRAEVYSSKNRPTDAVLLEGARLSRPVARR